MTEEKKIRGKLDTDKYGNFRLQKPDSYYIYLDFLLEFMGVEVEISVRVINPNEEFVKDKFQELEEKYGTSKLLKILREIQLTEEKSPQETEGGD